MSKKIKRYKTPKSLSVTVEEPPAKWTNHGWWEDLTEEQIASIEEGIKDLEAGRVISSEELWKKYGRKPLY